MADSWITINTLNRALDYVRDKLDDLAFLTEELNKAG